MTLFAEVVGPLEEAVMAAATPASLASIDHGPPHWERVAYNGLKLAMETRKGDVKLAILFGLVHDAFRHDDGADPEHGRRAEAWLRGNETLFTGQGRPLSPKQFEKLGYALAYHSDGFTSYDPAVGVCWDADRLELLRVGILPDARFFSTQAGARFCRELGG